MGQRDPDKTFGLVTLLKSTLHNSD